MSAFDPYPDRKKKRYKDGNGEEHDERRVNAGAYFQLWNRKYPLSLANIAKMLALVVTIGTSVGWLMNRFIFPWPTRKEVAESIKSTDAAIAAVKSEHDKTREEIAELKTDAKLTAQAVCALSRKFAPENAPPGCAPVVREMEREQNGH